MVHGTPRGNQQQPTTSWRARTAFAHGTEATVATIHLHTGLTRASAPEECVRDSTVERGDTHAHTLGGRATRGSGIVSKHAGARSAREAAEAKVRVRTAAGTGARRGKRESRARRVVVPTEISMGAAGEGRGRRRESKRGSERESRREGTRFYGVQIGDTEASARGNRER